MISHNVGLHEKRPKCTRNEHNETLHKTKTHSVIYSIINVTSNWQITIFNNEILDFARCFVSLCRNEGRQEQRRSTATKTKVQRNGYFYTIIFNMSDNDSQVSLMCQSYLSIFLNSWPVEESTFLHKAALSTISTTLNMTRQKNNC